MDSNPAGDLGVLSLGKFADGAHLSGNNCPYEYWLTLKSNEINTESLPAYTYIQLSIC